MTEQEHKECFGTMFPDDLHLRNNVPNKGKVFTSNVEFVGGMMRRDRSIEADIQEWDDCQRCPEFESCYRLCLAKVALESAIATQ